MITGRQRTIMANNIFLTLLMSGCILTGKNMAHYNPTDSMCLDALVVNMQAEGCDVISIDKAIYGVSHIYCQQYDEQPTESSWINREFKAIAFGTSVPEDAQPICTDPFLIMTMVVDDK